MIKGIIFDLDGVLLSTDDYHYKAWKNIADSLSIPFTKEDNDRLRGVSRMDSLEIVLSLGDKELSLQEKEELCNKKNEIYVNSLQELTPSFISDDVRDTLKFLKDSDIKLAIGSVSKNTRLILEKTDLEKYFDVIVDGTMISRSKPDPEVYNRARELLNLSRDEVLVVEDATSGIDSATAAGIKTCGIQVASKYSNTTYPIEKLSDIIDIAARGIVIQNVDKIYPNGLQAVTDFNLEIDDKEFVIFVGPSGCGKSTMMRMIAGLEDITSGKIYINGEEVNDLPAKDRDVAMVFQNYALYPHYTVRQNIALPLVIEKIPFKKRFDFKYRKERKKEINQKVEEVASKIGLTDYLDVKPENLSGGQRQRVALGRAIIRNPKIFLFDEPLSNLDAKMRSSMRAEILKLHKDLNKTFIYVTHDQVEAMTMADKIVVMNKGEIQQIDSPYKLYHNPRNLFVAGFIGTPQMNFIDGKLDNNDDFLSDNSLSIKVDDAIKNRIVKRAERVVLGIRPKDIVTQDDKAYQEDKSYSFQVELVEQLGDSSLLHGYLTETKEELVINTDCDRIYKVKDIIKISINSEHISLFDKETTNSILD